MLICSIVSPHTEMETESRRREDKLPYRQRLVVMMVKKVKMPMIKMVMQRGKTETKKRRKQAADTRTNRQGHHMD